MKETKQKSTLKDFLERAIEIDKIVRAKTEQMQRLRDMQIKVGGNLVQDKVQTSPDHDKWNKISDGIMDLEREYLNEIDNLMRAKCKIKRTINELSNFSYRLILEERYVNTKDWKDVAADNNYSERRVYELHGEALKELTNWILQQYFDAM